jgi:hypothetical protein
MSDFRLWVSSVKNAGGFPTLQQNLAANGLTLKITIVGLSTGLEPLPLNNWVMHPVARVSIKYSNNLRTQQSIF